MLSRLLLAAVGLAMLTASRAANASLFVSAYRTTGFATAFRFNTNNGAGSQFAASTYEEADGVAFGPNGNLFLATNTLGQGDVREFNGATGAFVSGFVNGSSSGLNVPEAIRFGPDGNLYVASNQLNGFGTTAVMRYNGITGASLGAFVPQGSGGIDQAYDLAFGPDGNLYVSTGNFANTKGVFRYDGATGAFLNLFVPSGSGGLAQPTGIAFGADGNLYVADPHLNSILRYNGSTGAFIGTFVSAGSGGLNIPLGIGFGPDGFLYACSSGNDSILRYDPTTGAFVDALVPSNNGLIDIPHFLAFSPIPEPSTVATLFLLAALVTCRSKRH